MHFDAGYLRRECGEKVCYTATALEKTTGLQNYYNVVLCRSLSYLIKIHTLE